MVVRAVKTAGRQALEEMARCQEMERKLLSYDLHDGLAQDLAALWMHLQANKAPAKFRMRALALVERMARELERTMRELQRPVHDGVDLHRALSELLATYEAEDALDLQLVLIGLGLQYVTGVPALFTYRIVQEALRNAVRRGAARQTRVILEVKGEELWGQVEDDGRGFEPHRTRPGYGLTAMRERCRLLAGEFKVKSRPGHGTVLRFRLPLSGESTEL